MKKLFTLVAVVACVAVMAGCKEKVPSPTEAFKAWLHAIEVCDVPAIKDGLTEETVTQFTQMGEQMKKFVQPGSNTNPDDLDIFKQMCAAFKKTATVKDFTEEINNDEARVKFAVDGKENSAPMKLTEKGWKLDLAKMMREAFEAQMEKMKIQGEAAPAPAPEAAPAAAPAQPEVAAPANAGEQPAPAGQEVKVPTALTPPPAPNSAAAAATVKLNPSAVQPSNQVQLKVGQKLTAPVVAPFKAGTVPSKTAPTTTNQAASGSGPSSQAPATQVPATAPTGN